MCRCEYVNFEQFCKDYDRLVKPEYAVCDGDGINDYIENEFINFSEEVVSIPISQEMSIDGYTYEFYFRSEDNVDTDEVIIRYTGYQEL